MKRILYIWFMLNIFGFTYVHSNGSEAFVIYSMILGTIGWYCGNLLWYAWHEAKKYQ